jgi:hypothetical protein
MAFINSAELAEVLLELMEQYRRQTRGDGSYLNIMRKEM